MNKCPASHICPRSSNFCLYLHISACKSTPSFLPKAPYHLIQPYLYIRNYCHISVLQWKSSYLPKAIKDLNLPCLYMTNATLRTTKRLYNSGGHYIPQWNFDPKTFDLPYRLPDNTINSIHCMLLGIIQKDWNFLQMRTYPSVLRWFSLRQYKSWHRFITDNFI